MRLHSVAGAVRKAAGEVAALRLIAPHSHIVRLHAIVCSPTECALVVSPSDSDLYSLLERQDHLAETEACIYARQIADALRHLHSQGWAHRDVKPEHISIISTADGPHTRLVDFGEAARCERGMPGLVGFRGTPLYMAPEVAAWYGIAQGHALPGSSRDAPNGYDMACDCWSLGVTIFAMLCGESPWDQDLELAELLAAIQQGEVSWRAPIWTTISTPAIKLTQQLLVKSPTKRMSAAMICEDPWVLSSSSEKDAAANSVTCIDAPFSTSSGVLQSSDHAVVAAAAAAPSCATFGVTESSHGRSAATSLTCVAGKPLSLGGASRSGSAPSPLAAAATHTSSRLLEGVPSGQLPGSTDTPVVWGRTIRPALSVTAAPVPVTESKHLAITSRSQLAQGCDVAATSGEAQPSTLAHEAPGVNATAGALLAAAADELEAMRNRLRQSRAAHAELATRCVTAESELELLRDELSATEREAHDAVRSVQVANTGMDMGTAPIVNVMAANTYEKLEVRKDAWIDAQSALANARHETMRLRELLDAECAAHLATRAMQRAISLYNRDEAPSNSVCHQSSEPSRTNSSTCSQPLQIPPANDVAESVQHAYMSVLAAEVAADDDVQANLSTALTVERQHVVQLLKQVELLDEDVHVRDERLSELQLVEAQLRLELQAKRQRIVACERMVERASDLADSKEAEAAGLRDMVQRWKRRCMTAENELRQAKARVVEQETHLLQANAGHCHDLPSSGSESPPSSTKDAEQLVSHEGGTLSANTTTSTLLDPVRRSPALLIPMAPSAWQDQTAHLAASSVSDSSGQNALAVEVANLDLRDQLASARAAVENTLLGERSRHTTEIRALQNELHSCESALARVNLGMEIEIDKRTAVVAAAVREASEKEWRQHLAQAVLLTREQMGCMPMESPIQILETPDCRPKTPSKYTSPNGEGQLALLSDMGHLRSALAAAAKQRATRS